MFRLLDPGLFEKFYNKCEAMYKDHLQTSLPDQLLIYACLSNICSHLSGVDQEPNAASYFDLARFFSNLLLQAFACFPMMMPASAEVLEVLIVAVCSLGPQNPCKIDRLNMHRNSLPRECASHLYLGLCRVQRRKCPSRLAITACDWAVQSPQTPALVAR